MLPTAECNRLSIRMAINTTSVHMHRMEQGEGREGVEAIQVLGPSVMRASRGVRRSNCQQIWRRVYDPAEGMLKLLLYKILLV